MGLMFTGNKTSQPKTEPKEAKKPEPAPSKSEPSQGKKEKPSDFRSYPFNFASAKSKSSGGKNPFEGPDNKTLIYSGIGAALLLGYLIIPENSGREITWREFVTK